MSWTRETILKEAQIPTNFLALQPFNENSSFKFICSIQLTITEFQTYSIQAETFSGLLFLCHIYFPDALGHLRKTSAC